MTLVLSISAISSCVSSINFIITKITSIQTNNVQKFLCGSINYSYGCMKIMGNNKVKM
jgi:hypothetical protein